MARQVLGRVVLTILGRVFMVIGAVGLLVSGGLALWEKNGGRDASAPGKIIAIGYRPSVEFTTEKGEVIRFTSIVRSDLWSVGDALTVAYDPAAPTDAAIDGFAGRWFFAGLAAIMACTFGTVGVVLSVLAPLLWPQR